MWYSVNAESKGQGMQEKIVYFEKPGKENTAAVIDLVLERASERGINRLVVASTCGNTAHAFSDAIEGTDLGLIVVPWQFGFAETHPFPAEMAAELEEKGHMVVSAQCCFIPRICMERRRPWPWPTCCEHSVRV